MAQRIIGLKKFLKFMDKLALSQLPFATSNALNTTAFGAQGIVRKDMPNKFILRNNFVVRGILVKKSTKRTLSAAVFSRDNFMLGQETGGERKAFRNRLAVPDQVRTNIRRRITKAKRPRNITKKPKVFLMKHSIVQRKGGKKIRRASSGSSFESKYKILYRLRRSVTLKPRFDMRGTVDRAVVRIFPGAFKAAYIRAIKSAKI